MRLALTNHAVLRMIELGVTRQQLEQLLSMPDTMTEGVTADEYTGQVGGRTLRAFLARNTDPQLVITVMVVRNSEEDERAGSL